MKIKKHIYNIALFCTVFLCCSFSPNNINYGEPGKHAIDSVKNVLKKHSTDTGRFRILLSMFWQNYFETSVYSKTYGYWAFDEIKNSRSEFDLANGYDILANILKSQNNYDSAQYCLTKALELSTKIGNSFRISWSYYGMGEIADKRNKHNESIRYFKIANVSFQKVNKINYPEKQINSFIGSNYAKLNNIDSANEYFEKNIEIAKKNPDKTLEIFELLDTYYYYRTSNHIKQSTAYLYRALKKAEELQDSSTISRVYWIIGDVFYEQKRNFEIARNYYLRALDISNDKQHKFTSSLYTNIGKMYLEEGNNKLAMDYVLRGLAISLQTNYRHALSDSYENLGYVYKNLKNDSLALGNFILCWQTQCDYCPPISFHKILTEIADIYLKIHNHDEALKWYKKSLQLANSKNETEKIALSKFKIGSYYLIKKNIIDAEKYFLEAYKASENISNLFLKKTIADTLNNFYLSKNLFHKAYYFQKTARILDDSLSKIDKESSMANLEVNFEFEKARNESEAKSKNEIAKQKLFRNFLLIISLLLSVFGIFIFLNYRKKIAINKEIEAKNEEICAQLEEILNQKDEILSQKNEIEKISSQLHEADQLKLRFFTNVSHELRTPLTLIISPLQKLFKSEIDNKSRDLIELMIRNSKKLQNMINQLLDISRLDKNELKLNIKPYSFNKQVITAAAMFQSIADEKNIEFKICEIDKDLKTIFDAERIDQVVKNLLSNAFKFTPEGGKIYIELCKFKNSTSLYSNEFAQLKIRDNGIGIPPESIDKVFNRFYQSEATINRNFEGSGIGLALTKEFVALHNGSISVKSVLGEWTEFTVLLPIISINNEVIEDDYDSPDIATISKNEFRKKEKAIEKKKYTVLLVEDNVDLQVYIGEELSKEFNTILASNGKEGIESALIHVPDIIISDVMMPEFNGYQLVQQLKNDIRTSHIPIILLTAKADRSSKIEGLENGADDYINKPFDEEELLLKVRNILEGKRKLQEKYRKQLTVNPSEINQNSLEEEFLAKLINIIEAELSNSNLDAAFICSKINLSHSQLNRKLNALTDLSINQFIRSFRLKRAAQLLQKKAGSVSEIAYTTGFENPSYFTRKFKEEFGVLPSDYN